MERTARCWFFEKRPSGDLEDDTMVLREIPLPEPGPGEFEFRSIHLSLDATNRVWISDWDMYTDPVRLGDPMRGFLVGEVTRSNNPDFPVGSLAVGTHTWADRFITDGTGLFPFPRIPGLGLAEAFGTLMIAGPTALYGLMEVGRPKPGQTVVVSAAAGAVGALVGQIAKLHGCRAVGIAGGPEKCRRLTEEFGYDAAVDYRGGDLVEKLRAAVPEGIDVLFENVGGECLDAGLTLMNDFGSVVICGLISTYNAGGPVPGPYMFRNVIMRRLRVEGFVILDHFDKYPDMQTKLASWMLEGKLKYKLHVVDGLENALSALKLLYTGGNDGKLMVRIGHDPH